MNLGKRYKNAMTIGYLFENDSENEYKTENWTGTEDCSTFVREVLKYMNKNGLEAEDAYYEIKDYVIDEINNGNISIVDKGYDSVCRAFIAGEIIGDSTIDNLKLANRAEHIWAKEKTKYGYFQELLNDIFTWNKL